MGIGNLIEWFYKALGIGADRTGRFLLVDVYAYDLGGNPKWEALAKASDAKNQYVGAVLKITEGTSTIELKNSPYKTSMEWLRRHWPLVKAAGGDRYGVDWFRGGYHFLKFNRDPIAQANFYVGTIDAVGGFEHGDLLPIVDVELGKPTNSNFNATAQQIIDCTSVFAERVRTLTGRRVILYGRGAMRDKGIVNKMSCDVAWNPSYTTKMVTNGLVPPWSTAEIALWQYTDGEAGSLPDYPHEVPGFGKVDLSVFIDGVNKPQLAKLRKALL